MFSVISPFSTKKVLVTKVEEIDKVENTDLYKMKTKNVSSLKYRREMRTVWTGFGKNASCYTYFENIPYTDYETETKCFYDKIVSHSEKYLKFTYGQDENFLAILKDETKDLLNTSGKEATLNYFFNIFTSFEIDGNKYFRHEENEEIYFWLLKFSFVGCVAIGVFAEIVKEFNIKK